MSTSVSTHTYTYTHTATYLADMVMGTLSDAISQLGLPPTVLTNNWATTEAGILQWIQERSLNRVSVEFSNSTTGMVLLVIDFDVEYSQSGSDVSATFRASKDRILRFVAKYPSLPSSARTRLVVNHFGAYSDMPGWSSTNSINRAGLRSTSGGTLATAPGASASMNIYD